MSFEITCLSPLEILDSSAHPTFEFGVQLAGGIRANASASLGRPTRGRYTADPSDQGILRAEDEAVAVSERIKDVIRPALLGRSWSSLAEADQALASLDADPNAPASTCNATIGVSMALARALARSAGRPLYAWLPGTGKPRRVPTPLFSILTGCGDIPQRLPFASIRVYPVGAPSLKDAIRAGVEVYRAAQHRLVRDGLMLGTSDDGGLWCSAAKPEIALRLIVNAIRDAGYPANRTGIAIALDVDASALRRNDGSYQIGNEALSGANMVSWYTELVDAFPICSIVDGLAADDTAGWQALMTALGDQVQLVGDEVLGGQLERIRRAKDTKIANAMAIRLDRVATVSQALEAIKLCTDVGLAQVATQSPAETIDSFIADLAVATGCSQIASGSPTRGERVAKYNRLLQIATHIPALPYGTVAAPRP